MTRSGRRITTTLLALALIAPAYAQAEPPRRENVGPVIRPDAEQWEMVTRSNGHRYRILVAKPKGPPPAAGWPVIYMLDGASYFHLAADQLDQRGGFDLRKALVVAIGWADDDFRKVVAARWRDFTPVPPAGDELATMKVAGFDLENFGGAPAFRRFLIDELRAAVAAAYPVDPAEQHIFGHSLAGLFVVDTLFQQPSAFRSFVAVSPSVYWGNNAALRGEGAFLSAMKSTAQPPAILLMVGGDESTFGRQPAPPGLSEAQVRQGLALRRMVANTRELGARLASLNRAGGNVRTIIVPGENHVSVTAPAVVRALEFALAARKAEPRK